MFSLSQLVGYHHILRTSHHPQSNRQVERSNSTFVTQIAKTTDYESNNWHEYLYSIVFTYNTGIYSTANIISFELKFHRLANLATNYSLTAFTFYQYCHYFHQLLSAPELNRGG
ncbi:unnamed protein product, partial [Rotaria sp. Silwood2]